MKKENGGLSPVVRLFLRRLVALLIVAGTATCEAQSQVRPAKELMPMPGNANAAAELSSKNRGGHYEFNPHPRDANGQEIYLSKEGRKMCRRFADNLNARGPLVDPLWCGRPIRPEFKEFSAPNWRPLNSIEHMDLLLSFEYQHEKFSSTPAHPLPSLEEFASMQRPILEGAVAAGQIELQLTKFDLNGDGHVESIVRYHSGGPCSPAVPGRWRAGRSLYYVVNDDLSAAFLINDIPGLLGADAFVHRGKWYFNYVFENGPPGTRDVRLHIDRGLELGTREKCGVQLLPDQCPISEHLELHWSEACELMYRE